MKLFIFLFFLSGMVFSQGVSYEFCKEKGYYDLITGFKDRRLDWHKFKDACNELRSKIKNEQANAKPKSSARDKCAVACAAKTSFGAGRQACIGLCLGGVRVSPLISEEILCEMGAYCGVDSLCEGVCEEGETFDSFTGECFPKNCPDNMRKTDEPIYRTGVRYDCYCPTKDGYIWKNGVCSPPVTTHCDYNTSASPRSPCSVGDTMGSSILRIKSFDFSGNWGYPEYFAEYGTFWTTTGPWVYENGAIVCEDFELCDSVIIKNMDTVLIPFGQSN